MGLLQKAFLLPKPKTYFTCFKTNLKMLRP